MKTKRKTVRVPYASSDGEQHTVTLDAEYVTLIREVHGDPSEWVQKQHDLIANGEIKEVLRVFGKTQMNPTMMGKVIRARALHFVGEHCKDL